MFSYNDNVTILIFGCLKNNAKQLTDKFLEFYQIVNACKP